jgi:hypothetical protein
MYTKTGFSPAQSNLTQINWPQQIENARFLIKN